MAIFGTIYIHGFETKSGKPPSLKERASMRKVCGPYQWTPSEPGKGRGFYQSSKGLEMGDSTFKLRLESVNDHLSDSRLKYVDGYYCDPEYDGDTLQPIIARLNHDRGFLAGWTMGKGMCASLNANVYATAEEAARAAHYVAEMDAENDRERQLQERENESIEEELEEDQND